MKSARPNLLYTSRNRRHSKWWISACAALRLDPELS